MATTDKRGKRVGGADTRVSEAAKANMPAYGFDGMTFGEISDLRAERRAREHSNWAAGGDRKGTEDKKR